MYTSHKQVITSLDLPTAELSDGTCCLDRGCDSIRCVRFIFRVRHDKLALGTLRFIPPIERATSWCRARP
jgi:aryl carrier-like protein